MRSMLRRSGWCIAGLGLALAGLSGCQTNIAGLTLPSGYYLKHRPQYFPREPAFPLPRELATMQAQHAAAVAAATAPPAGALPEPVVPPPAGAPADAIPDPVVPPAGGRPGANPAPVNPAR
jgi:hypothetical protein